MLLERPGIHPGNNMDHTPCRPLQQPAPLALDLCLCSLPPRGHSVHCSLRDPVIEPYPIAPKTTSSVTPLFSENQALILIKAHKAPHDLPPWHLCLIPFGSPSIHPLSSSQPGPSCCSNRPGTLLLQPLLNAFLSQKVSLKLWRRSTASILRTTLYLLKTYNLP